MITPEQKELLIELNECQGHIFDGEFKDEQRKLLEKMQSERPQLVALCWVLMPAGEQAIADES